MYLLYRHEISEHIYLETHIVREFLKGETQHHLY